MLFQRMFEWRVDVHESKSRSQVNIEQIINVALCNDETIQAIQGIHTEKVGANSKKKSSRRQRSMWERSDTHYTIKPRTNEAE